MSKKARNRVLMVILFSVIAIAFAVVYSLHLIKKLDAFLAMTNLAYFTGLATMYLGSYHKEKQRYTSMRACYILSGVLILGAIVALVYGLAAGEISLFL